MITFVWEAIDESGNTAQYRQSFERAPASLPEPKLSISWSNGRVILEWPAQPEGWWLESSGTLLAPTWKPVAIEPVLANGRYTVGVDPIAPTQWFRLATGAPPLAIAPAGPASVLLLWPSLAGGYTVQRCTDLSGGTWVPEAGPLVMTNGMQRMQLEAKGRVGFFRLVRSEP